MREGGEGVAVFSTSTVLTLGVFGPKCFACLMFCLPDVDSLQFYHPDEHPFKYLLSMILVYIVYSKSGFFIN